MASDMINVHNILLRGINSIYNQCLNVSANGSEKDKLDFSNFAYQWGNMLEEHHRAEEESFFPEMNSIVGIPGLMDANVQQHQLFHHGIESYNKYLSLVKEGQVPFEGQKLKGIIDDFMPVLRTHLNDEITTLVSLEQYENKCDWGVWFQKKGEQLGQQLFKDPQYRVRNA